MSAAWSAAGSVWDGITGHSGAAPQQKTTYGNDTVGQAQAQAAAQAGANAQGFDQQAGGLAAQQFGSLGASQGDASRAIGDQQQGEFNGLANKFGNAGAMGANQQAQSRQAQANALNMYGNAAAGNGPSAAQAQLQAGTDASIAAQQAQANSARGGNLANAGHNAAMAGAQVQQANSNAAAQLRAQEQQAAMAGYAGAAGNMRGQDIGTQQFGMQGEENAAQFGAGQNLAANEFGMNQQMAGLKNGFDSQLGYNTLGQNTGLGYGQLGQNYLNASTNADLGEQSQQQGVISGNSANSSNLAGSAIKAFGALAVSDPRAKVDARADTAPSPTDQALETMLPHTFAYANPANEPRSRPDGGRYLGVMADRLATSPAGARAVETDPADGLRKINPAAGLSLALAGEGRLHQRVSALEAKFGKTR